MAIEIELLLLGTAAILLLVIVLTSPLLRAICWDSFAHPLDKCTWEKHGNKVRELKAGIDYLTGGGKADVR